MEEAVPVWAPVLVWDGMAHRTICTGQRMTLYQSIMAPGHLLDSMAETKRLSTKRMSTQCDMISSAYVLELLSDAGPCPP